MTTLLLAVQFLTIFPVRISGNVRDQDLAASMRWYPLVGALLGALSGAVYSTTLRVFSPVVAVVSAVIALILLSGALHLEGFADMCDGFYGQHDRKRILEIMKDSRSGPIAIVGLFCLLAIKLALLGCLEPARALPALTLAPALGRCSMVWLCATSRYARPEGGTAHAYVGHVDPITFWIATLISAVLSFLLLGVRGVLVLVGAAGFTALFRYGVLRRIGGMTGDTLGASCEIVETLVLAAVAFYV
jgi:adenosylcobinamide-GDP ribazoletransferase